MSVVDKTLLFLISLTSYIKELLAKKIGELLLDIIMRFRKSTKRRNKSSTVRFQLITNSI